jgi:hypothetical protein
MSLTRAISLDITGQMLGQEVKKKSTTVILPSI